MKMILMLLLLLLTGCSDSEKVEQPSQDVQSDFGLLTPEKPAIKRGEVLVMIPEQYVPVDVLDNLDHYEMQTGIKEATFNSESSQLELIMTDAVYEKLLAQKRKDIEERLQELETNEDLETIRKVKYDETFNEIVLTVEQSKYTEGFESFAVFNVISEIAYLQLFEKQSLEPVTIFLVDVGTNEQFDEVIYFDNE